MNITLVDITLVDIIEETTLEELQNKVKLKLEELQKNSFIITGVDIKFQKVPISYRNEETLVSSYLATITYIKKNNILNENV